MNLYLLATVWHNRKVQERKDLERKNREENCRLEWWLEVGQEEFDRREDEWRRTRAKQKKEGKKPYRGSWRQRRGHGFGWRVVRLASDGCGCV